MLLFSEFFFKLSLLFLLAFVDNLSLILNLHYLRLKLSLSLAILFYALVDKVFSFNSLWVVRVPVLVVPLEKAERKVDIIDNMLNFCCNFLDLLFFFSLLLKKGLLILLQRVFAYEFLPFNFGTHAQYLVIKELIDVVEFVVVMVGKPHHMEVGFTWGHKRMVSYFFSSLANKLKSFLDFGVVWVFFEQSLQYRSARVHISNYFIKALSLLNKPNL